MRSPTLKWIGLALLGLLIAAAVSIAASRLASQQIGLASEPIEAGDALAPVARSQPHRPKRTEASHPTTTTPATPPPTVTIPPATSAEPPASEPSAPAPSPTPGPEPSRSGGDDGGGGGERSGGGGHADD